MAGIGTKNPMGTSPLGKQIKNAVQKSPLGGQIKSAIQKSPLGGQIKSAIQKSPLGGTVKAMGAGMKSTMGQAKGSLTSAMSKVRDGLGSKMQPGAKPSWKASPAKPRAAAAFDTLMQNAKKPVAPKRPAARNTQRTPEQSINDFMNSRSNMR
jgi:hypothetical protein